MMQKKNRKQWNGVKLILFIPIILMLLQAFAEPEILVGKVNDFVPSIIQKDSSEVWLDNWTIENLKNINGGLDIKEFEIAPPPPGYPKSNLPKYDKSRDGHPIPTANIFTILINRKNMILASGIKVNMDELLNGVAKFLNSNPAFAGVKKGPELVEKNFPYVGDVKVTKGVITLRYDVDTKKEFIQNLLRNIGEIHLEARKKASEKYFEEEYFSLTSEKKNVINQIVPIRVSIVPPKTTKPPLPPKVIEIKEVKKPLPPPPPNTFSCTLSKNGEVTFGQNKYTIPEFGKKLEEHKADRTALYKKWGMNPPLVANVEVEDGISGNYIIQLKEVLRKAKIQHVNYSSEKKTTGYSDKINSKEYDVVIHKDHLEVFNESCTLNELNKRIEKNLKNEIDKKSIAILAYDNVPPERLKKIRFEINNIPDIRISTTIVKVLETDAESISHKVLLKENGDIYINDEKYSLPEFEKQIVQLSENIKDGSTLNAVFEIEDNTTGMQVETVKQILRKANVKQVNHEIKRHWISETTPFADPTQPVHVAGCFLNSPLTSRQLRGIMASANHYLRRRPNIIQFIISTNKNTSKDDIKTLKEELLKAGYKKITVNEKS